MECVGVGVGEGIGGGGVVDFVGRGHDADVLVFEVDVVGRYAG